MRHFALVILLGLVLGCGNKSDPTSEGKPEPKHEATPEEPVTWKESGKEAAVLAGLEMEIVRVGIRPQPDKEYVEIVWLASTKVPNGQYLFRGWKDTPPKLVESTNTVHPSLTVPFDVSVGQAPMLEDGFWGALLPARKEAGVPGLTVVNPPETRVRFQSVYRDGIWRALYFDRPKDANEWRLELDGSAFGLKGTFRFKIDPKTAKMLAGR